jgi:hypothetical protein
MAAVRRRIISLMIGKISFFTLLTDLQKGKSHSVQPPQLAVVRKLAEGKGGVSWVTY